mgnify:CR=1 FL=1
MIIIDQGKIVANDTPENLKKKTKSGKLDDLFRQLTVPETTAAKANSKNEKKSEPKPKAKQNAEETGEKKENSEEA